jgi:HAE1 family hydrophobic/amphiphilic exporter-1
MVSIPASLIATFIGIYLMGYTLNNEFIRIVTRCRYSCGWCDCGSENIYRHMEMGKTKFELPMMVAKLVEL